MGGNRTTLANALDERAATQPSTEMPGRQRLTVVVTRREEIADGVVALTVEPPDGAFLPAWEPGAHIDVELGKALIRQYSLCGDRDDRSRCNTVQLVGFALR